MLLVPAFNCLLYILLYTSDIGNNTFTKINFNICYKTVCDIYTMDIWSFPNTEGEDR